MFRRLEQEVRRNWGMNVGLRRWGPTVKHRMQCLLLVLVPGLCAAADGSQAVSPKIPVRLDITAEQPLHKEIQACLGQELAMQATVVDQGTALTLAVIASEQRLEDGTMLGYLIYAGGYQPAQQAASPAKRGEESDAVIIQWQVLRMVPPDFAAACGRIAEEFVASVVEPTRREQERLRRQAKPGNSTQ